MITLILVQVSPPEQGAHWGALQWKFCRKNLSGACCASPLWKPDLRLLCLTRCLHKSSPAPQGVLQHHSPVNTFTNLLHITFSSPLLLQWGVFILTCHFPRSCAGRRMQKWHRSPVGSLQKGRAIWGIKAQLPVSPESSAKFCMSRIARSHFQIKSNLTSSCSCLIQQVLINWCQTNKMTF